MTGLETIKNYRRFSLAADSVIEAAASVNTDRLPEEETFNNFIYKSLQKRVFIASGRVSDLPAKTRLQRARAFIEVEVNTWLAVSGSQPRLGWDEREKVWRRKIAPLGLGVLGAIAMALFTTVPSSSGWLICDICGNTYQPERAPVDGRNHYCKDCRGSREMNRLSKRRWRSKKRNQER